MSTVLAIDQGTSGTKAVVVDEHGATIALAEVELRPSYLPGGGVEQDPHALLDSVLTAGRAALARAGRPVDAVALANQGETVLAWDPRTGAPLSPAIVWQDRRAQPVCARLKEHAPWVTARTGLVLDPYFSAPKMAWLRSDVTTEGVVTTVDTWLVHRLTGEYVTDAATASRSLLMDLDSLTWDPELTALFGLGDERLPRIVDCAETVGTTTAFGRPIPVTGLVTDQQAALFAEGCLESATAKCTYGTGAFLLANTGNTAPRSAAGLTTSVAWRTQHSTRYCVDGQVYTAASAVRWLQNLGLIASASQLDTVAARESDGTLCVPALAGLAAPWWRGDATATFAGMTLSTGREHLVLAVLQGIAAQVATVCGLVGDDLGAPLTRLRADGGLTRSRTLMQAQADIAQLPVDIYPSAHATALGAAALARLSLDPALSPREALGHWEPVSVYEPAWSADRAAHFRRTWETAAEAAPRKGELA
ncbi:FGGY family carbohydrate kinase [Streptomyces tsukubensis]|uniref:ATP:glycerol 3-phosphotransferase n=1 Tax=Streptomyces tsukubensis TaxID=83656 RepID=A0A1V4AFP3_9ACTN|nr:FGGY family carbohydrate kinase [Streptomyces tsukubensis]OON82859.1 carbohydrate kinase [Streptomyces tsukubensis]QFR91964.1 carbohydrate kinase [Streptomyces tsukubensis]